MHCLPVRVAVGRLLHQLDLRARAALDPSATARTFGAQRLGVAARASPRPPRARGRRPGPRRSDQERAARDAARGSSGHLHGAGVAAGALRAGDAALVAGEQRERSSTRPSRCCSPSSAGPKRREPAHGAGSGRRRAAARGRASRPAAVVAQRAELRPRADEVAGPGEAAGRVADDVVAVGAPRPAPGSSSVGCAWPPTGRASPGPMIEPNAVEPLAGADVRGDRRDVVDDRRVDEADDAGGEDAAALALGVVVADRRVGDVQVRRAPRCRRRRGRPRRCARSSS